jgi:hypothetical protein
MADDKDVTTCYKVYIDTIEEMLKISTETPDVSIETKLDMIVKDVSAITKFNNIFDLLNWSPDITMDQIEGYMQEFLTPGALKMH